MAPEATGAVNALTVDSKLLGAFWELASVDKSRREARPLQLFCLLGLAN